MLLLFQEVQVTLDCLIRFVQKREPEDRCIETVSMHGVQVLQFDHVVSLLCPVSQQQLGSELFHRDDLVTVELDSSRWEGGILSCYVTGPGDQTQLVGHQHHHVRDRVRTSEEEHGQQCEDAIDPEDHLQDEEVV